MKSARLTILLLWCATASAAQWQLCNPTRNTYIDEQLRLKLEYPGGKPSEYTVKANGRAVPFQVDESAKRIWVLATVEPGQSINYSIEKGTPAKVSSTVKVETQGDSYVLSNGRLSVKVPAVKGSEIPSPVLAVRPRGGRWTGSGSWHTTRRLKSFNAAVTDQGPVFARVRLEYRFEGKAGLYDNIPAFSTVEVSLFAGENHAVIEETHEMGPGNYWQFDCAANFSGRDAICIPHSGGFDRPDFGAWPPDTLKTGQTRMGDKLLNLMPRWTQAYDEGWFFACASDNTAVGALVCRAGKWHWPHDNMIEAKVKDTADYAGLICPTRKGRRYWFLVAGPRELWADKAAKNYVKRHAFEALDRLVQEFILKWPGLEKPGSFSSRDYYSSSMNPSGAIRGFAKSAMRQVGKPGNISTLTLVQNLLHNDAYGSYWNFWSPENPNFYTDYIRGPVALTTRLTSHPRFGELRDLAISKLQTDLYHSITLPGGAGQECPGYVAYAMKHWAELVEPCMEYLDYDLTENPRYAAGASFLLHLSQPVGNGERRCHPGGDTHPLGPDVFEVAERFDALEDIKEFSTEELPGFGAVFRNRPGTDSETYLAFKSGPNRGHYHGDQLSFHYCADARQLAIDHMCSYSPRAGAEHMHNRLAFHTEELPYANMDGYERLIAFKTSPDVDIAVGQVESPRLRATTEYPPEVWDSYLPQQWFDRPLKYRRTIVAVKNSGSDYFVIRDQYAGPDLNATYCLHVLSDSCKHSGNTISFDRLTVYCAEPSDFEYSRHDWLFEKKNKRSDQLIIREDTRGIRLTVKGTSAEFITVLYPSAHPVAMKSIPGGVRVGNDLITFAGAIDDVDGADYVTVKRGSSRIACLSGADIDMNHSQGNVGLFVPDAGYPFGPIPNWLIRQRAAIPEWAPDWVRAARKYDTKSSR